MKLIWLKILGFFVEKPTEPLKWNSKDLDKGKRWSKTQPHPHSKKLTLWDFCEDYDNSVLTINNLNKVLFT